MRVQSLGWEDPLEEGMATHCSILAWRIPMDRGAWRATVYKLTKSWTRLKRLSTALYIIQHSLTKSKIFMCSFYIPAALKVKEHTMEKKNQSYSLCIVIRNDGPKLKVWRENFDPCVPEQRKKSRKGFLKLLIYCLSAPNSSFLPALWKWILAL